jgi:hypothetical protein
LSAVRALRFDVPRSFALGGRIVGVLEVHAEAAIHRAKCVIVTYVVSAHVRGRRDGEDLRRSAELCRLPFAIDLPADGLAAGVSRFPFDLAPPSGLPPTFRGCGTTIEHRLEATIEIAWARDLVHVEAIDAVLPPTAVKEAPLVMRSPPGFHPTIAFEPALESTLIEEGAPIRGQLALQSGQGFSAFVLEATQLAGVPDHPLASVRERSSISEAELARGLAVPFEVETVGCAPSFGMDEVSNGVELRIVVSGAWLEPSTAVPLVVVPRGSTIEAADATTMVGNARFEEMSRAVAGEIGVRPAQPPVLAEGPRGPVWIRVLDTRTGARVGVRVDLSFPDVEMGIRWTAVGLLRRARPELAPTLAERWAIAYEPEVDAPSIGADVREAFVSEVTAGLDDASSVHLGDDHLTIDYVLGDDDVRRAVALAGTVRRIAEQLQGALERLPFPSWMDADAIAAWRSAAVETGAPLVASGPALWSIPISERVEDGSEVTLFSTLKTLYGVDGPAATAEVDLTTARLPLDLDVTGADMPGRALLDVVRETFPKIRVLRDRAILMRRDMLAAPIDVISALRAFMSWVLEIRGLRREARSPYR